jgi:hypothetical protein
VRSFGDRFRNLAARDFVTHADAIVARNARLRRAVDRFGTEKRMPPASPESACRPQTRANAAAVSASPTTCAPTRMSLRAIARLLDPPQSSAAVSSSPDRGIALTQSHDVHAGDFEFRADSRSAYATCRRRDHRGSPFALTPPLQSIAMDEDFVRKWLTRRSPTRRYRESVTWLCGPLVQNDHTARPNRAPVGYAPRGVDVWRDDDREGYRELPRDV